MELGDKIKQVRLFSKMTQKELSRGTCSQAFLSKIENNLDIPNGKILVYLCKRMGILVEELFYEQDDMIHQKIFYRKHI